MERIRKQTYTDYEKLPESPAYQLIDGDLVMTPAPTPYHQEVLLRLCTALREHALAGELGWVFLSPIDIYFSDTETYQPDIVFISRNRRSIISEKNIRGAPDLVVEILSPGTGYHDLVHKKHVYEVSGVKELWMIDPQELTIEVMANELGGFRIMNKARVTGLVASSLLSGFAVDAEALFAPL